MEQFTKLKSNLSAAIDKNQVTYVAIGKEILTKIPINYNSVQYYWREDGSCGGYIDTGDKELEKIQNLELEDLNNYIKSHNEINNLTFSIVRK